MDTQTRSGNGLATLVVLVVAILGVGWFANFGDRDDNVGITRPADTDDDDYRKVTLIVNWSRPVAREVDIAFWVNGEKREDPQDESHNGQWIDFFGTRVGDKIRLLAENTAEGGYLSCHIFESTRAGADVLVAEKILTGGAGDCDIEHRVGDPPNVESLD